MNHAWRQAINAVWSTFLIAVMTGLPSMLGEPAHAQSEGEIRTVQQEIGSRTDQAAETSADYDPTSGVTLLRRKQDTVRLYNERTETYRQVGIRTETRTRQEPVHETRYRKEQRQRQEIQQVARTSYRQEIRNETRYRPVLETKTRQVARTGHRAETRYRTEYEAVSTTQAQQDHETYTEHGWRWETRNRTSWQWLTRHRTDRVLRWYTSPGYWSGSLESGHLVYPGGYWDSRYVSRWNEGYRYAVWEDVSVPYQSWELVSTPYQEVVSHASTASRPVTRNRTAIDHWRPRTVVETVQVPTTTYETESYEEPIMDTAGYRDVYGYTWVNESKRPELAYPGNRYGEASRSRQVFKEARVGREAIRVPRQEPYQVPAAVTVADTTYEPVTITVTYHVDVPYEAQTGTRTVEYLVAVPVYDWVPNGNWVAKEQVTRTQYVTIGRVGSALLAAESATPTKARSSTFLSDSGSGNTKTEISGTRKRLIFKADEVAASVAKEAEISSGSANGLPSASSSANARKYAPNPAATPAAMPTGLTADDWVGTWTQSPYTVTIARNGRGLAYKFAIRNRGSWDNTMGGTLSNGNATFRDATGGAQCHLTLSRVGDKGTLRITGDISVWGSRSTFGDLRK